MGSQLEKRIVINPELCNGCGICELVCALKKTGEWHPGLSRIKVKRDEKRHLYSPIVCAHCVEPPCMIACLMNVIQKDPETGCTVRNEFACICCHACEISCPFGACLFDYINEVVVNCDLCNGDPVCVKFCPAGALRFESEEDALAKKREHTAGSLVVEGIEKSDCSKVPAGGAE